MVETEFFLELLVRLLADPTSLDGAGQLLDRRLAREIGQVILALSGRAMFADEPGLFAGQVLGAHIMDTLWWSVCDPNANRSEAGRELSLCPAAS